MKEDIYKKFYEAEADFKEFLPEKDVEVNARVRLVYKLLPKKGVKSILDVGCGDGYLCYCLHKKYHVEGVDISEKRINRAKKLYPYIHFKVGALPELPYSDSSFDLVTAVETLEHVPELDEAMKELKRVSRKYILITVPYKERPTPVYCPYCSKVFYKNGHLHYFDEEILSNLMKKNNLRIIKMKKMCILPYIRLKRLPMFIKDILNELSLISGIIYINFIGVLVEKM